MAGNFWNHQLNIAVTPMTAILTFAWFGLVFWSYKRKSSLTSRYRTAIADHPDVLQLDELGVTWGVDNIATTKIAWSAVAFFRINSGRLELGLPGGTLSVEIDELDKDVDAQDLTVFLQSQGVGKSN